jgi:hypothetical protein
MFYSKIKNFIVKICSFENKFDQELSSKYLFHPSLIYISSFLYLTSLLVRYSDKAKTRVDKTKLLEQIVSNMGMHVGEYNTVNKFGYAEYKIVEEAVINGLFSLEDRDRAINKLIDSAARPYDAFDKSVVLIGLGIKVFNYLSIDYSGWLNFSLYPLRIIDSLFCYKNENQNFSIDGFTENLNATFPGVIFEPSYNYGVSYN